MVLKPASVVRAEAEAEQVAAREAVQRLAWRARDELGAEQVYLFGSRARKDWHMGSDCDVIVVSDRFEGVRFDNRWNMVFDLWDGPVDIQPVGVTPAEFENARDKGGLITMALQDGVVPLLDGDEDSSPASRPHPPTPSPDFAGEGELGSPG